MRILIKSFLLEENVEDFIIFLKNIGIENIYTENNINIDVYTKVSNHKLKFITDILESYNITDYKIIY